MGSDLTIPARLLAEGVGDPPWWLGADGYMHREGATWEASAWKAARVDLSDPQTAFGVLRQLALWCGDDGGGQAYVLRPDGGTDWHLQRIDRAGHVTLRLFTVATPALPWREALIAIVTHIGQDHAIRRALGWEVEPGTLAELNCIGGTRTTTGVGPPIQWCWEVRHDGRARSFAGGPEWAGADVLCAGVNTANPTEALAAIYEEVTCDR